MKKLLCLLLTICICLSMCACGGTSYGVKTVQTLVEQQYSLAFRVNDPVYFYVVAALETLNAEGRINELTMKWFGENIIDFGSNPEALAALAEPQPQTFIIGADINSFPLAYLSNDEFWGYDVELAKLVCERLGWTLMVQSIEKENVYIELSSGNIDCAWGGVAVDQQLVKDGKIAQYGPYVQNDIVIAARNGSTVWNKLRLTNRSLAMSSTQEALDALNSDEKLAKRLGQVTRLAGGTTACFEMLYAGKCDAVLTDSTALYYFNSH